MTGTLSSVSESSTMAVCRAGTLSSGTGVGWACTLCSGTWVGWGDGWGQGKAIWTKVYILLYAFCIYEPYPSECILFSFIINKMDSMWEAV